MVIMRDLWNFRLKSRLKGNISFARNSTVICHAERSEASPPLIMRLFGRGRALPQSDIRLLGETMKIINRLADRFAKVQALPEGMYHKQDMQDDQPYRVHLRLKPDGSGIFVLNASTVLHLNATSAEYAYHF